MSRLSLAASTSPPNGGSVGGRRIFPSATMASSCGPTIHSMGTQTRVSMCLADWRRDANVHHFPVAWADQPLPSGKCWSTLPSRYLVGGTLVPLRRLNTHQSGLGRCKGISKHLPSHPLSSRMGFYAKGKQNPFLPKPSTMEFEQ